MFLITGFILFAFVVFGKKQWDEIQSQSFLQPEKSSNHQKSGQHATNAVAGFPRQTGYDTTPTEGLEPRNARVAGIHVPYLVAQSTHAVSDDRLQQLTDYQNDNSNEWPHNDYSLPKNQAAQSIKPVTSPKVGFYSLHTPTPAPVQPPKNDQILIARDQPPSVSPFLSERLQRVAVHDLGKLPTQDLMRLLNHSHREISVQSESLLKKRDGFQEEHVQLAIKLYHPDSSVRKSLLPQLADNDQLETFSWLIELLQDPDQDVRLATAKAIYGQIPLDAEELERLKNVMQSDTDQRIAAVGQGLAVR